MEKQETQRPNVLADVEEIYEYPKDTSAGVSKDISEKCLLGKWLIEEPYALIGHVRFCEGLLRLEPLIAKQYMMKGCEKVETKSTRRNKMGTVMDIYQLVRDLIDEAKNQKNLELVDRLIEIKLALSEIEDENRDLKKRIEELEQSNIIEEDLELLPKGYYIRKSEKAEGKDIKYCAACWQNSKKLMPYVDSIGSAKQCSNCHNVIH